MVSITRLCVLSLLSMLVSTASAEEAVTRGSTEKCILQTVCSINSKLQCNNAISFGSADINKPGGFVITQPGIYCLKEDVVFNPTLSPIAPVTPTPPYDYLAPTTVQAAITIRSSNVVLDLGDHRLSQAGAGSSTQVPYVVGIVIPDIIPNVADINAIGLQSIYIKGGDPAIIDGFSMYGIRIFAHTFDIRLTNITIKNGGQLASKGLRPVASATYGFEYVPHTAPLLPGFGPSFGVAGLCIGENCGFGMGPVFFADTPTNVVNNVNRVNQVVLENVSCLNNFFMGLFSPSITDYTIDTCHFDETWSDDPGRGTAPAYPVLEAFGAIFVSTGSDIVIETNGNIDPSVMNMVVNNSTFNNSTLRGDLTTQMIGGFAPAAGVLDARSRNVVWNNCEFNGTTNKFVDSATTFATVGYISAGIEDSTFNNCHFDNVTSLGNIQGCHISGISGNAPIKSSRNNRLINCTSNNHTSIGNQQLPAPVLSSNNIFGFGAAYAKDLTYDGCITQDLIMNGPQTNKTSTVCGFNLASTSQQLPPLPDATVQSIVYRNCIASRSYAMNGGSVCGWNMQTSIAFTGDAMKPIVLENCISTENETFTPTLTTPGIVQGSAFGFLVLDENQTTPEEFVSFPIVFDSCKALHNKGLPSSSSSNAFISPFYSSGFYLWNTVRSAITNCDAIDNVYGFFLNACDSCTVRNCRADNNVDLQFVPGTGEGFTSIAFGFSPASPGVSDSTFETNRAFNNGAGNIHDGTNGNYNILYNAVGPVHEALLAGQLSVINSFAPTLSQPTYYAILHNLSVIE